MGRYKNAVVTTAGQQMLADALNGAEIVFTAIKTSSDEFVELQGLTDLTNIRQSETPTSVKTVNDSQVELSARFTNENVTTAYNIHTVGIYAETKNVAESLFAVISALVPDQMPAADSYAPTALIFEIPMSIQNADTINLTVTDAGLVNVETFKQHIKDAEDVYTTIKSFLMCGTPITAQLRDTDGNYILDSNGNEILTERYYKR